MTSDGRNAPPTFASRFDGAGRFGDLETMLFEALVHQLIEKGLLTKNDALSIVQTVAQVKLSRIDADDNAPQTEAEIALLRRIYGSFEALPERFGESASRDNVRELRPPLHGNSPQFPLED